MPVVRLLDTVTNSLEDGLDLGRRLVDEGLARFVVEVEGQSEQPLVRRLELSSCLLHLVSWKSDTWVTSAEVSLLHGSWKGYDLLERVLGKKTGDSFPRERIVEGKQEEVWEGLVEAGVGGLVDRNGQPKEHVSLYRLGDLLDILAILKVELREEDKAAIRSWLSGAGTVVK